MTCPGPAELAELATNGEGDEHLAECVACRAAVAEQRAVRALAQRAPVTNVSRSRREAIAAEVMARMDLAEVALASGSWRRAVGAVGALAAAAVLALGTAPRATSTASTLALASSEPVSLSVQGTAADDPAPARMRLAAVEGVADLTRASGLHDVIALHGSSVTLDARETREVDVTASDTVVHVDHAKARVVAKAGVIESVAVFAGSVEVTAHGKRQVIEAGEVWVAPPQLAPPDPARAAAVQPFLDGWSALRAGDNRAAIAAFDRASDPAVVEDAVYWAAVAAERMGDHAEATRRFADFLARFPESPHADSARAALR